MLCQGVSKLLTINGRFCLVLPENQSHTFINIANKHNLHLSRQQLVYPKLSHKANRINMEFRNNNNSNISTEEIVIREEDGKHTNQYKEMISDYLVNL